MTADRDEFQPAQGRIGVGAADEMRPQFGFHAPNGSRRLPTSSIGNFRLACDNLPSDYSDLMETLLQQRVRERLRVTGKKPIPAATSVGLGRDFITDILAGKKQTVLAPKLILLAQALECETSYFTDPYGSVREPGTEFLGYPLVGLVGAGGEGDYEDDYAKGAAREFIEPLPGMPLDEEIIVVEVDGESMIPAAFPGDLVFFGRRYEDPTPFINQRVMARLANGKKFFKILKRGSEPGTFTLRSFNPASPDIEDVELAWVLPYRGLKTREY